MAKTVAELYETFTQLVEAGDEQAVRTFLADHLTEFPEDVQKKIAFEFFAEALSAKVAQEEQLKAIQKEGIESLKNIEKAENTLKDEQKAEEVRSSLGI